MTGIAIGGTLDQERGSQDEDDIVALCWRSANGLTHLRCAAPFANDDRVLRWSAEALAVCGWATLTYGALVMLGG